MTAADRLFLLVHAGATLFMVGVIWFVQVVHYPLFDGIGTDGFARYETRHQNRITLIVGPAMLLEALAAAGLVLMRPASSPPWLVWGGVGLLLVIWLSTAFVQVPRHEILAQGFRADVHQALVWTNWLRTAAWSARGAIALVLIDRALTAS